MVKRKGRQSTNKDVTVSSIEFFDPLKAPSFLPSLPTPLTTYSPLLPILTSHQSLPLHYLPFRQYPPHHPPITFSTYTPTSPSFPFLYLPFPSAPSHPLSFPPLSYLPLVTNASHFILNSMETVFFLLSLFIILFFTHESLF